MKIWQRLEVNYERVLVEEEQTRFELPCGSLNINRLPKLRMASQRAFL